MRWTVLVAALIALGLVLTHPQGTTAGGNAITNLFTGGVKQLQAG